MDLQDLAPALMMLAVAALLVLNTREERRIQDDWDFLLDPESEQMLRTYGDFIRAQTRLLDRTLEMAAAEEDPEKRHRGLVASARFVGGIVNEMERALRVTATFSLRRASLRQPEPPSGNDFRVAGIAAVMRAGWLAHYLVPGRRMQLELRMALYGLGVRLAARHLRAAAASDDLARIDRAHRDLERLIDRTLESIHAVAMLGSPTPA